MIDYKRSSIVVALSIIIYNFLNKFVKIKLNGKFIPQ